MPAITILPLRSPLELPYDATGVRPGNLRIAELHAIDECSLPYWNLIVPDNGPMFLEGLIVTWTDASNVTKNMVEGVDYIMSMLFDEATINTAKPVYGGLFILDNTLTGSIKLTYQSLGGNWIMSKSDVINSLINNNLDPRMIFFDSVLINDTQLPPFDPNAQTPNILSVSDLLSKLQDLSTTVFNKPTTNVVITNAPGVAVTPVATSAIFMGGYNGFVYSTTSSLYSYTADVFTSGGTMTIAVGSGNGASTDQIAYMLGGILPNATTNQTTQKYVYASNLVTTAGSITYGPGQGTGAGNKTMAITGLGGGYSSSTLYTHFNTTSLYAYNSDTAVAGTNLVYASYAGACAGNQILAVFTGGQFMGITTGNSSTYTYSNNVTTFAQSMNPMVAGSASSTATTGYYYGGIYFNGYSPGVNTNVISLLNFASGVNFSYSYLSYQTWAMAAAGNATTGVVTGGWSPVISGITTTTSLFNYSSNTSVTSSAVGPSKFNHTGASPNIGVNC